MEYHPSLGGALNCNFPLQFGKTEASALSFACTLVKHLSNNGDRTTISHGSGCFWRHKHQVFLLTARHVITGRSPFDDRVLCKYGFIPHQMIVFPTIKDREYWYRSSVEISVSQERENWLQDPEFENLRTDIAAVLVCNDENRAIVCLNDTDSIFEDIFTTVGMECSIAGYPTPDFNDLMTPIWRRGSIASEPLLPLDGKPMFLLDASTSPGFSGAPVFRQHFGPLPIQDNSGSISVRLGNIRKISFVGIYAGRLRHSHVGGEVPFVFFANRVPRVFAQR